jgi:matrixin
MARPRPIPLVVLLLAATVLRSSPMAYATNGVKWNRSPISYVVNPVNLDLPEPAVIAAVRAGADAWALQSAASFRFEYAGTSAQTTNTFDSVNLVMFRNASSGSAIATTYWWSSGSNILDADIVFWDGGFRFYSGTSGCSGGFYIEDIAAHEFGHALGLGHSSLPGATMYPSTSSCNASNRILDPDDIAGVETLYPPVVVAVPSAPTNFRIVP